MSASHDWEALLIQAGDLSDEVIEEFFDQEVTDPGGQPTVSEDPLNVAVRNAQAEQKARRDAETVYRRGFGHLTRGEEERTRGKPYTPSEWREEVAKGEEVEKHDLATDAARAKRLSPVEERINSVGGGSGIATPKEVQDQLDDLGDEAGVIKLIEILGPEKAAALIWGPMGVKVVKEKERLHINSLAREDLASEHMAEEWKVPEAVGIASFLAHKPTAPSFHIQGLWPHGGMVLLNAAKKWGKTTNVRHTVECVLTGTPLYGQFEVTAPFTKALVIDNELSHRQMWDMWEGSPLTDEQLIMWPLRQSLSSLAIRNEWVRNELVKRIAETGADLLVIDPLGPLLRANQWEENSNTDVGMALDLLAEMAGEAGVTGLLIPHHTGHDGAHARGASVIGDKADAIWTGTLKRPTDPYGVRLFGAIGRSGVSQKPVELSWDENTRSPFINDEAFESPESALSKAFALAKIVEQGMREGHLTTRAIQDYVRQERKFKATTTEINAELKAQKDAV